MKRQYVGALISVFLLQACGQQNEFRSQSHLSNSPLSWQENRFSIDLGVAQDPPLVAPGPGAGEWGSEPVTLINRILHRSLFEMLGRPEAVLEWGPDAVGSFRHYLENSGADYEISLVKFLLEVPSARALYRDMFKVVREIASTLPDGTYTVGSRETYQSRVGPEENENWHLAVDGYSAWIRGSLRIEGRGRLAIWNGAFYFWDSYDWDPGVVVPIRTPVGTIPVDQDRVGELHRQGLAKEFDTIGSHAFRHVFQP